MWQHQEATPRQQQTEESPVAPAKPGAPAQLSRLGRLKRRVLRMPGRGTSNSSRDERQTDPRPQSSLRPDLVEDGRARANEPVNQPGDAEQQDLQDDSDSSDGEDVPDLVVPVTDDVDAPDHPNDSDNPASDDIEERERRRHHHRDFFKKLDSFNVGKKHEDLATMRMNDSMQWAFAERQVEDWIDGKISPLVCWGSPGVGKTFFSSTIIDRCTDLLRPDKSKARSGWVAWIYFEYNRRPTQAFPRMIKGLIAQFCKAVDTVALDDDHVNLKLMDLTESFQKSYETPKQEDYTQLLRDIVTQLETCYVVIDALDESQDLGRNQFMTDLRAMPMSVLVTSRDLPHIRDVFSDINMSLEIRTSPEDIKAYAHWRIWDADHAKEALQRAIQSDDLLQEAIEKAVATDPAKMNFNAARHQMNALTALSDPEDVRRVIEKMPYDADSIYELSIERLKAQPDQGARGLRALAWVYAAKRPLSSRELSHALVPELTPEALDNSQSTDEILEICEGLIDYMPCSDTMVFAHPTIHEFLASRMQDIAASLDEVPKSCIEHVKANINADNGISTKLFSYASRYWFEHCSRDNAKELFESWKPILGDPSMNQSWHQYASRRRFQFKKSTPLTPIETACRLEIPWLIDFLCSQNAQELRVAPDDILMTIAQSQPAMFDNYYVKLYENNKPSPTAVAAAIRAGKLVLLEDIFRTYSSYEITHEMFLEASGCRIPEPIWHLLWRQHVNQSNLALQGRKPGLIKDSKIFRTAVFVVSLLGFLLKKPQRSHKLLTPQSLAPVVVFAWIIMRLPPTSSLGYFATKCLPGWLLRPFQIPTTQGGPLLTAELIGRAAKNLDASSDLVKWLRDEVGVPLNAAVIPKIARCSPQLAMESAKNNNISSVNAVKFLRSTAQSLNWPTALSEAELSEAAEHGARRTLQQLSEIAPIDVTGDFVAAAVIASRDQRMAHIDGAQGLRSNIKSYAIPVEGIDIEWLFLQKGRVTPYDSGVRRFCQFFENADILRLLEMPWITSHYVLVLLDEICSMVSRKGASTLPEPADDTIQTGTANLGWEDLVAVMNKVVLVDRGELSSQQVEELAQSNAPNILQARLELQYGSCPEDSSTVTPKSINFYCDAMLERLSQGTEASVKDDFVRAFATLGNQQLRRPAGRQINEDLLTQATRDTGSSSTDEDISAIFTFLAIKYLFSVSPERDDALQNLIKCLVHNFRHALEGNLFSLESLKAIPSEVYDVAIRYRGKDGDFVQDTLAGFLRDTDQEWAPPISLFEDIAKASSSESFAVLQRFNKSKDTSTGLERTHWRSSVLQAAVLNETDECEPLVRFIVDLRENDDNFRLEEAALFALTNEKHGKDIREFLDREAKRKRDKLEKSMRDIGMYDDEDDGDFSPGDSDDLGDFDGNTED